MYSLVKKILNLSNQQPDLHSSDDIIPVVRLYGVPNNNFALTKAVSICSNLIYKEFLNIWLQINSSELMLLHTNV